MRDKLVWKDWVLSIRKKNCEKTSKRREKKRPHIDMPEENNLKDVSTQSLLGRNFEIVEKPI